MEIFATFLFFINMMLFIGVLIGVIVIGEKVSALSKTVEYLTKTVSGLQSKDAVHTKKNEDGCSAPESQEKIAVEKVVVPQKSVHPSVKIEKYERKKDDFELQNIFLGNVFNKIGAVAIIVAVVIFIKLISPFIVLTPLIKIVLSFLAGFAMIGGAFYMHRNDSLKNYSEVLMGTGFATLFVTSFCGYSIFNLYNTVAAVTIGAVLLLGTFTIAGKMKTPSMLIIGLIGGYLTPIFSGTSNDSSMWYLIFLNLVSIVYTLKNQRHSFINIINLFITMIAFIPYVIEPVKLTYPLVLWGIYILYDILRDKSNNVGYALSILNYGVLILFSIVMFHNSKVSLGCLLLTTAIVYAGLALYSYVLKNSLSKTYSRYILLNLWFGILFILSDVQSVCAWSITALVIAGLISRFKANYLAGSLILYCSTAFVGALLAKSGTDFCLFAKYAPIINIRTLVFGVPILTTLSSALLLKKDDEKTYNLLTFGGVSLAYLYLVGEINSLLSNSSWDNELIKFNKCMIYSIIGFIYALQTKRLYRTTNYGLYNVASWLLYPIALFILFSWSLDFHYQTGYLPVINLRTAAYSVAILTNIIFARWNKLDFFKYFAIILGWLAIHFESCGIVHMSGDYNYLISLAWVLYSGTVTICGIQYNKRYLINSGIFMIILSILRIFIYDLAKVEALYKLIAFLALGIILMLVSYIYTLNKKKD